MSADRLLEQGGTSETTSYRSELIKHVSAHEAVSDELTTFAVLSEMLDAAALLRLEDVPALLRPLAPGLDAEELVPYVIDYHQRLLVPFPDEHGREREPQDVEASLAGRCFRENTVFTTEAEDRMWLPMLDDTERLGVLEVRLSRRPREGDRQRLLRVSGLLARIIATRATTGDRLEHMRRQLPMTVAAEMQWGLLPPLTMSTPQVTVSGILEPCYDIGGDTFDYAINGNTLHLAVFDAMGHGLGAAQMAALTVAAYRNARRIGLGLVDTFRSLDRFISSQFQDKFVTGLLAELDTETGRLETICAGHPAGLLFRQGQKVKTLAAPTALPLGLGVDTFEVGSEGLQPGDGLLLYTDGIVEARSKAGEEFGVDRLVDFMVRQLAAQQLGPETMRRLLRELLEHQEDELQDDASAVFVEWGRLSVEKVLPH